jgi:hypothetical protein
MKSNKLIILALVTVAVIFAATMMSRHRAPTTSVEKQTLFPGLLEKVNDVNSLSLTKYNQSLTLSQIENKWGIEQADNYPADFGKVRETVIAVADLMILAEKTSNADFYEKLGVEDPAMEDASSLQLSLLDSTGNSMAKLIVGNARHSKSPGDKDGLYVRLPDSKTALLVQGRLNVSADVKDWFTRELFSIDASRIKNINIVHADASTVKLSREQDIDDFIVEDLPDGMEMQSNVVISRMGTILEDIFVDNVMKLEKLTGSEQTTVTIHTFDGLVITITSAEIDGINYSGFSFAASESTSDTSAEESEDEVSGTDKKPKPAEEAKTLNSLMSGWAYAIPSFKHELFTRKADQLIRKAGSADETSSSEKAE